MNSEIHCTAVYCERERHTSVCLASSLQRLRGRPPLAVPSSSRPTPSGRRPPRCFRPSGPVQSQTCFDSIWYKFENKRCTRPSSISNLIWFYLIWFDLIWFDLTLNRLINCWLQRQAWVDGQGEGNVLSWITVQKTWAIFEREHVWWGRTKLRLIKSYRDRGALVGWDVFEIL